MSDLDDARRQRKVAADRLLDALTQQALAVEEMTAELARGRADRLRARERIEDVGGHEADTVFGSWLDSDDRLADRLTRYTRMARETAEATRAHIATTELLLFELDPGIDDPRASP